MLSRSGSYFHVLAGQRLQNLFPRHHVDGVVVGRAAELALLRGGRVAERHAQAAANAQISADGAHHPAVAIGLLDDATGHRAGGLTNRTGERPKTAVRIDDRNRLRSFLARPAHHLGPHGPELYLNQWVRIWPIGGGPLSGIEP